MYYQQVSFGGILTNYMDLVDEISFIYRGKVVLCDQASENSFISLGHGSYFGDWNHFLQVRSGFRIIVASDYPCELLCIETQVFGEIIDLYPRENKFLANRAKKRYLYFKRMRNHDRKERSEDLY